MRILSPMRIVLIALLAALLSGCGYNEIQQKDEAVKAGWSEVLNQYKRRADLIPNLVQTVKGYAAHEQQVLTQVTEARAKVSQINVKADDAASLAQFQKAQGDLSQALSRLMVVTENYPNLKADQQFIGLQTQLEGTENRITIARRDYNEAVRDYNTTLRTFPSVIWAKTIQSGSKPMQLFTATAEAQSAPQVNFNLGAPPSNASAAPGGAAAPVAPGSTPPAQ